MTRLSRTRVYAAPAAVPGSTRRSQLLADRPPVQGAAFCPWNCTDARLLLIFPVWPSPPTCSFPVSPGPSSSLQRACWWTRATLPGALCFSPRVRGGRSQRACRWRPRSAPSAPGLQSGRHLCRFSPVLGFGETRPAGLLGDCAEERGSRGSPRPMPTAAFSGGRLRPAGFSLDYQLVATEKALSRRRLNCVNCLFF